MAPTFFQHQAYFCSELSSEMDVAEVDHVDARLLLVASMKVDAVVADILYDSFKGVQVL
jgi:hypothetical protein